MACDWDNRFPKKLLQNKNPEAQNKNPEARNIHLAKMCFDSNLAEIYF